MLELSKHNITMNIENLKDFITVSFVIIDDIYQEIASESIKNRRNINTSIMNDSEIITIALVGELLTIDSENAWIAYCKKNLRDLFPKFPCRTRFNRTRRALFKVMENIRKKLNEILGIQYDNHRIVDSMPIYVCKFGRTHFHKTFKGVASYGRCASKKETYYGFKLHTLNTLDGYLTDYILTPANVDDRIAIWELVENKNLFTLLSDKGYIGKKHATALFNERGITLVPIKRLKAKFQFPKEFRQLIFKKRRLIETVNSQLTEQLNISKILAKSLFGIMARLETKILAHNLCYFINIAQGNIENMRKIKQLIFG
ncbi:IS982 family transposase [Clostridium sp. FAM 1755]|uniref:IS982 family transposase n=1 Tax=Clostridium caseinilyticum TaxID=3350403 RepID=UPI0038F7EE67